MTEYAKEKFNELWTSYRKGELITRQRKVSGEEERSGPDHYVSTNVHRFTHNAERLINQLSEVRQSIINLFCMVSVVIN
jgi:hypothetical protein